MLLAWIGRVFRAASRFGPVETAKDLDHVGEELIRLDARPRQPPATSR
jgi:hypothetical protein